MFHTWTQLYKIYYYPNRWITCSLYFIEFSQKKFMYKKFKRFNINRINKNNEFKMIVQSTWIFVSFKF